MNKIRAFKFPHDSLEDKSLFENDFIWPNFFWKFSVAFASTSSSKKEPPHRCFLVNFLNIF